MKKTLMMLCYRAPYPLRSGCEIRMYQFLEILSEFYDIDLFYVREYAEQEEKMRPLHEKCRAVRAYDIAKPVRAFRAVTGYLFRGRPFQVGWFYSPALMCQVREHLDDYDGILCMHVRMAGYLLGVGEERLAGKNLYFDGTDAITLNYYNSYRSAAGIWNPKKWMNFLEYRRMAKYEKCVYETFSKSSLISERDRDYIMGELGAACDPAVIYNYAIDYGYLPELPKEECVLAFMGKMNYAPNVDAMLHFCGNVFPHVRQMHPALKLWIIGGFVTPEIEKLAKLDGVTLCGFVENPAELLQRATLVIAPMVSGSGLQNKIVQAMYLGAAVVTTPIGADGLAGVTERELVIARDDTEMTEKLCDLLSPERGAAREKLGAAARTYIREHYSYDRIRAQMAEMFSVEGK